MKTYEVIKPSKEHKNAFDYLIIAISYKNPLSEIEDIIKELDVTQCRILFDLTLINGLRKNRFISCNYKQGENITQNCKILTQEEIDDYIHKLSGNFFESNVDIVMKSRIPNALKHLLIYKG